MSRFSLSIDGLRCFRLLLVAFWCGKECDGRLGKVRSLLGDRGNGCSFGHL